MVIEEIVVQYLLTVLAAPVYGERPEETPETYFLVEKVGGRIEDHLSFATLAVRSVAKASPATSLVDAAHMNEVLKDAMLGTDENGGLLTLPQISAVRLNSDYNNTDPETGEYEYQAVFDITHY